MLVTAEALAQQVREVAQRSPDTQLSGDGRSCRYFNSDNTPCCIVGHALVNMGITAELSQAMIDDNWEFEFNTKQIFHLFKTFSQLFDAPSETEPLPHVYDWLRLVQKQQDGAASWAHAVAYADRWAFHEESDDAE